MNQMNLSKALKLKNKLVGDYSKKFRLLLLNNSRVVGTTKNHDGNTLLSEVNELMDEIVALKTAIHKASDPIREKIFLLSELKSYLTQIENLSTQEGLKIDSSYSGKTEIQFESDIDYATKEKIVEGVNRRIDTIQDEIDVFNATTILN